MPFIQLTGGAYTSRSLIAAAQRCLNLYIEQTPRQQGEPFPAAHYCTPGLTFQGSAPQPGCRGLYTSYSGDLYACYGQQVLHYSAVGTWTLLGVLGPPSFPSDATARDTPVSMVDNGIILLVVDGSKDGWFVDLTLPVGSQKLNKINLGINTGFLGADIVSYQDTFFILNSPGTAIYYISLSNINAASLTAAFSVQTVILAPTGTGYSAGDVLTLTGTGGATITVNTVTSGTISTYSITTAGSTATQPTNPVSVTGGTGTGATFNLTFLTSGSNFILATAQAVITGSAYNANDLLTLPGTGGAQVTVNSVDANGAIIGYGVTNGGAVDTQPANPVAATGGAGKGAVFVVTYQTNVGGFDPLDFAAMDAQANELVAAVSVHRNLWLIGTTSYEIWINTGGDGTFAGSFPFQIYYPGAFANWGCAAKYSIAGITNQLFWLSQDKFGHGMVMRADNLAAKRISTHAIEVAINEYPVITDAIAYTYQQEGHNFYVLSFPSANSDRGATWVFDGTTDEWHERCYIDSNGIEYQHLCVAASSAYGKVYAGDWRNGNLYTFDLDNYTDNGMPIKRLRSFPHQIDLEANRRVMYHQLIAQMQVGSSTASGPTQTVVDTEFDATDGTLLQNFHSINALGANFTRINATNAVILGDAVQATVAGNVLYSVSGAPTTPNYAVEFTMKPTSYDGVAPAGDSVFIVGRATSSNGGYQASIFSDGTQYFVRLYVIPTGTVSGPTNPAASVPLGSLTSGSYQVTLTMIGSGISVAVQRTQDGLWANSQGIWGNPTNAIAITDTTFTAAGGILLGGNWDATPVIPPMTGSITQGVAAGAAVGTLGFSVTAQSGASITLSGVAATSADGIPTISIAGQAVNVNLVGVTGTSNTGTLSVVANSVTSVSITLSGVVGTSAIGTLTPAISHETISVHLTGVSAAIGFGNLTVTASAQVTLFVRPTGVTATTNTGTISASIGGTTRGLAITGVASTTAITAPIVSGNMAAQNAIYVLSGVVAAQIAAAPVAFAVVEATSDGAGTFLSPSFVTQMKNGGQKKVLGYLDAGWIENYRPYYNATLAAQTGWTGPTAVEAGIVGPLASPAWPMEYEGQYWSTTWHTICTDWCAKLQAAGFDGIYLDVIDAWGDSWPVKNAMFPTQAGAAAAMIALINAIRTFAHSTNPNFLVWVNGGEELFAFSPPAYVNAIDGMLKEQVLYDPGKTNSSNRLYEKGMLDNCKNAGKPVVLVEYVSTAAQIADVKSTCASWGYGYYIANPNLNLNGVDQAGFGANPPPAVTPPPQASAAGFGTLVFQDDFTSNAIATTTGAQSGFNWYWSFSVGHYITSGSWSINTAQTAAGVSNGNTSGGSNASSAGGILTLNSIRGGTAGFWGNSTLCTVPNGLSAVPSFGSWQHAYFEAYIQYNPVNNPGIATGGTDANGFPAFWSWGVEGSSSFGNGGSLNTPVTEIDFMEDYSGVFGDPIGMNVGHVVNPAGNGVVGSQANYPTSNAEWHTFGCLWTSANQVSFYKDNVLVGSATNVSGLPLAATHQFVILGAGIGQPVNVDWVRVWQA